MGAVANVCQTCAVNSQSPAGSGVATSCVCNTGTQGPDAGPCTLCIAGTYKIDSGDALCTNCLANQYSAAVGAVANVCQTCAANSQSLAASGMQTDCTCNAGWSGINGEVCTICAAGTYRLDNFQTNWARACGPEKNEACHTEQSSFYNAAMSAEQGVDGNINPSGTCAHTSGGHNGGPNKQWWMVDLGLKLTDINGLSINSRNVHTEKSNNYNIYIGNDLSTGGRFVNNVVVVSNQNGLPNDGSLRLITYPMVVNGQYVYFRTNTGKHLILCEVQVWSSQCAVCPSNSISLTGSTLRTDCECLAGYTGPDGGGCTACVSGKYKPTAGSTECVSCLTGQYSADIGATSNVCQNCLSNSDARAEASDSQTDCTCNSGYTGDNGGSCSACVAGKYKISTGDALCTNCVAGQYSVAIGAISDVCQTCPSNSDTAEASDSQTDCTCNSGYTGEDGGSCSACVAGKYSTGSAECTDCAEGQYSTVVGAGSDVCQACPVNSVSMRGSDELVDCQCNSGSTGSNGGPCTACVAGKYKTTTGDEECTDCSIGQYSTSVGAESDVCQACTTNSNAPAASAQQTDCTCNAGTTMSEERACVYCAAGTYKTASGNMVCTDCMAGQYSAAVGAITNVCTTCPSHSDSLIASVNCLCNAGYSGNNEHDTCTLCAAGTYKYIQGSSACLSCPDNAHSPEGSVFLTNCVCNAGRHSSIPTVRDSLVPGCFQHGNDFFYNLPNTNNFGGFTPEGSRRYGCTGPWDQGVFHRKMRWEALNIDIHTLRIDKSDRTFATRTAGNADLDFAIAGDCVGKNYHKTGKFVIDFRDTPFAIEDFGTNNILTQFQNVGWGSQQFATCDSTNQRCELRCGGGSGYCQLKLEYLQLKLLDTTIFNKQCVPTCETCPANSEYFPSPGSTHTDHCICVAGFSGVKEGACTSCEQGKYKGTIRVNFARACGPQGVSACPAQQNTTYAPEHSASKAVDGDTMSFSRTDQGPSWWRVDLQQEISVYGISILGRVGDDDTAGFSVYIGNNVDAEKIFSDNALCVEDNTALLNTAEFAHVKCEAPLLGRFVYFFVPTQMSWRLHEVQVWSRDCVNCPANSGNNPVESTAESDCKCNAGSSGIDGSGFNCLLCAHGKYQPNTESTVCEECASGKYLDLVGQDDAEDCKTCPANSNSPRASVLVTDCVCDAGWSGGHGETCIPCDAGTFKDTTGSAECTACMSNSHSLQSSTAEHHCECHAGFEKFQYPLTGKACTSTSQDCDNFVHFGACRLSIDFEQFPTNSFQECTNACLLHSSCNVLWYGAGEDGTMLCRYSANVAIFLDHDVCTYDDGWNAFIKYIGGSNICKLCPSGTYNDATGSSDKCATCPAESDSPKGSTHLTDCTCNAGATGVDGAVCTLCSPGTYKSNTGDAVCIDCEAGEYSTTIGATLDVCQSCAAGKFQASTAASSCDTCPLNSNSPIASTSITVCSCNAGWTGLDGGTCTYCPTGTYKSGVTLNFARACGSDGNIGCPVQQSSDYSSAYDAERAVDGDTSVATYTQTEAGGGAAWWRVDLQQEISINTLSIIGRVGINAQRTQGFSVHIGGNADIASRFTGNTVCVEDQTAIPDTGGPVLITCRASGQAIIQGRYVYISVTSNEMLSLAEVQIWSTDCTSCPIGTYSEAMGGTSVTQCMLCPAGFFSTVTGLSAPADCESCVGGKYSDTQGATSVDTCIDCPEGKYSHFTGSISASNCDVCPTPYDYSPAGSTLHDACICPTGTIIGAIDLSYGGCGQGGDGCDQCCPGTFSASPASTVCIDCVSGKFSSLVGASSALECITCPPSTVSSAGSINSAACICAPGTYTDDSECIACPNGKYATEIGGLGQGVCNSCPEATYSHNSGSTICTNCPTGKTSPLAATTLSACQCPAGMTLDLSTDSCTPCFPGTYSHTGHTVCSQCTSGKYSQDAASSCTNCMAGTFSGHPGAGSPSQCESCPAGTFSSSPGAIHLTDCVLCFLGSYSKHVGATSGDTCIECPKGTYGISEGSNSLNACKQCSEGKYSQQTAATHFATCQDCLPSAYSDNKGTIACTPCPKNTFSLQSALTSVSSCLVLCVQGQYRLTSSSRECTRCPSGSYMQQGSNHGEIGAGNCKLCAIGTYYPPREQIK